MSCNRYKQLLSRYVDGEVTPRQKRELLAHLEQCPHCAAWLARVRQADILLKGGVPETRPPDYVRDAVLAALKSHHPGNTHNTAPSPYPPPSHAPSPRHARLPAHTHHPHPYLRTLRLALAGLLLRFDLNPRHLALAATACLSAVLLLAYWLNILPPPWGYTKLGFEIPSETNRSVDSTPLPAFSTGYGQPGVLLTAPNPVRLIPTANAHQVAADTPISIRFDQPMDRTSVEKAIRIDPPTAGSFLWDADNEVRFAPTPPGLIRGITYTVQISNTARSLAGTPLSQPIKWSFDTVPPHSVQSYSIPAPAPTDLTVPLTASFTLTFDVPMDTSDTSTKVWLRTLQNQTNLWQDLPFTLTWSDDGRTLTLSPTSPLPEGTIYLGVASTAHTRSGDTLGQAAEFSYRVAPPTPRLRLTSGQNRVVLAFPSPTAPVTLSYEVMDHPTQPAIYTITFTLYNFPAERLSELGAQARPWPLALPPGLPDALTKTKTDSAQLTLTHQPQTHTGLVTMPPLPPGIYLVVASTSPASNPAPTQHLSDWQLLLISDRYLTQAGPDGPFWATDEKGRPWTAAEVSLYSPTGVLLEKGLTDQWGLWTPTNKGAPPTLAVARDPNGHLAAMLLDPQSVAPLQANNPQLNATLLTDLPSYQPGQQVNFRLLLHSSNSPAPQGLPTSTPLTEQEVDVALLTPSGSLIGKLTLKPDLIGGVSGLFDLSPQLRPGTYTIRVSAGGMHKDYPLTLTPPAQDTLSVYILPSNQNSTTTITRTVSVLDPLGRPATGATITATLRISGENWTSNPVSTIADPDGRATVVLPLPDWFSNFNEPALYLQVEARLNNDHNSNYGSNIQYLDYTSLNASRSGIRQLVSPSLDFAAIALPLENGTTRLRIVSLGKSPAGDLLLIAHPPETTQGNIKAWSLDLRTKTDITINLARNFADGHLRFMRAGLPGYRELQLMPAPPPALTLQITAPDTLAPGEQLPVQMQLLDTDSPSTTAVASLWLRRVADMTYTEQAQAQAWEPGINLQVATPLTTTLIAPASPGLWYVMAQATTQYGAVVRAWTVVRVLPGPLVQLPPARLATAWEPLSLPLVVHNPTNKNLTADLQATNAPTDTTTGEHAPTIKTINPNSQPVSVAAGGWQRLQWQILPTSPGTARIRFSFAPGAGIEGAWDFTLYAQNNPHTITTYTSGLLTEQRTVGVQVPSGLNDDTVQLEIRASTSLMGTLSQVATDLPATAPYIKPDDQIALAAARLSSASVMASAYRQLQLYPPAGVQISGVEQPLLLQALYSNQQPDGSWGNIPDNDNNTDQAQHSRLLDTANVLLALRRHNLAWAGTDTNAANRPSPPIDIDMAVVNRGLIYLHNQLSRPVGAHEDTSALDNRAYGLYVLSAYGVLQPEMARPFIAYASDNTSQHRLSVAGQAWLALALWQAGSTQDALALLDHLLTVFSPSPASPGPNNPDTPHPDPHTLAPVLEALVMASEHDRNTYQSVASRYMRALIESQQGPGWGDPATTANALWALSRYAIHTGEQPQPAPPLIFLNDHPVQASRPPGTGNNIDTLSLVVGGNVLSAGTNWLRLQTPTTGQTLYYSLTLKATR